jgi:hypothetical protein
METEKHSLLDKRKTYTKSDRTTDLAHLSSENGKENPSPRLEWTFYTG